LISTKGIIKLQIMKYSRLIKQKNNTQSIEQETKKMFRINVPITV
jgi:hypothetical protein